MLGPKKPLILASCALVVTALSVTALSGQVAVRRRPAAGKMKPVTAAPMPVLESDPPVCAVPGSPEAERMAECVARVNAGLVKSGDFGEAPKQDYSAGPRMPDFVGTEIIPQKKIAGEMLAFQRKLSALFPANAPIPASRIAHFTWLKAHPDVRVFGWYGTVIGAEVRDDSSVIVVIEFHAKTEITGRRANVHDYVKEKYLVANGTIELIDTDAAIINPAIQVVQDF